MPVRQLDLVGVVVARNSQKPMDKWVLIYVLALVALGAYVLYILRPDTAGVNWLEVAAFGLIIFTAEAMPVELPRGRGTVSVSYAVIYAAILVLGPGTSTWLAAIATLRLLELTGRVPTLPLLFNRAQLALSAAAAGLTYVALGGVPGHIDVMGTVWALIGAAAVYSLVNITTVVAVMSLSQKKSFWGIWVHDFRWMIPHYLALTPLGVLIAVVQAEVGLAGVLLLFGPLALARYSLQLYAQMRKAYLATIQAMVAAIEARDPYTAGHSRRVAAYTVATAKAMRLPEDQTERLEYAAWLHDVGKLAVPDHILQKKDSLTPGEWDEMRRHPVTGANILRQIKLLGRDIDVILHHHERWNGEGYPGALRGDEIPLGARLIAIADAYEAMTSIRPYRVTELSQDDAFSELRRSAGSQFDPGLVELFIRAVSSLPAEVAGADVTPVGIIRPRPTLETAEAGHKEAAAAAETSRRQGRRGSGDTD
jgi:putative nucleotidyltransferase with HDIG domain